MKRSAPFILGGFAAALLAIFILAPKTHYEPGALLAAHGDLRSGCASCHEVWRGPSTQKCVDCHGNLSDSNPHAGFDVTQGDVGLEPSRKLVISSDKNLVCLSCHSEHQGTVVNIGVMAGFACTYCHKHPAIDKVPEHIAPEMKRQFFVRHLFKRPFNHDEHRLLILSHYPAIPGGFACTSCHTVPPVAPRSHEEMTLKWSGCAGVGCHVSPQDSFMQMPASIGPTPVKIAYSGVFPMRHMDAVFMHSAGHLETACADCHNRVARSRNPDDASSLAVRQCFTCHAHQKPPRSMLAESRESSAGSAFAAEVQPRLSQEKKIVSCGGCHLFHTFGVVPLKDFPNPAPKFVPGTRNGLILTVYLPRVSGEASHSGPSFGVRPVHFSPWWLGWIAIGLAVAGLAGYVRMLPRPQSSHEAVPGVAPQREHEVPALDDTYQTNVPHLYIIGEAAGTASINLAMRSGRQVIEAIAGELKRMKPPVRTDLYDVLIVGCGPAGLGATATAKVSGLHYATLEKMTPASTLRSYPRAKFVQATPIEIAEYGSFFLEGDNSREELIAEWEKIISKLDLTINEREEVADIVNEPDGFVVKTARGNTYAARCVVLAIGVRGNPRHLNMAGEDAGRVFYNLIEPREFMNRKILVVGGGNAGAEVAQALAAPDLGNTVSYSFRSAVLTNVTRENAERVSDLQKAKLLYLYPSTALVKISPKGVTLEPLKKAATSEEQGASVAGPVELENDAIFAMIGAELPTRFLKAIGVRMMRKGRYGT